MEPILDATVREGRVLGALALPVCVWAAYTDLASMRIRNHAVLALIAAFVLAGPFVMAPAEYLWRFAQFALVLVAGFLLNRTIRFGAGDAKFAAAMALYVAPGDSGAMLAILSFWSLAGLALHRLARRSGAIRRATPGWESWEQAAVFPFGISLAAALSSYLALAATLGT